MNDPRLNDSDLVDETLRRRFEEAWINGAPLPIADCLPDPEADSYLSTLEELVHIQLEFAWKTHRSGSNSQPSSVETLMEEFPSLCLPDVIERLQKQESECRNRAADTIGTNAIDDTNPVISSELSDQATIPPTATTVGLPPVSDQATIPPPTSGGDLADDQTLVAAVSVDHPTVVDESISKIPAGAVPQIDLEGYELLGELGRGGMGVVYRALDTRLKRVVALKMVLAGVHADPEDLKRFQLEAEAVAQLQHPNIVQIHDVGEHEGRPYFSLEFVEGGELASRIAGEPQPPEEAAQLVETLSRAMHFAHERNIIHRDLKPANVLLTADGQPKITDFGLAKRLEDESGQTASGSIMGTPSYMSPEQAGRQQGKIGPPTDVYALGALLYCLLTGRPPFQSSSVMDTVLQVLEKEPVPPHQLVPGLDKNLETITLKCLQKDPGRRYQTAEEVADELQRFINHEPILARPVSAPERAWRWCRRKPVVASLILGLALSLIGGTVVSSLFAISERQQREVAETEQRRAQQRFEQAVEVVDRLVQVCQHLAFYPGVQEDRVELLKLAGEYYGQLSDDASGGRELRINSARTLLKLGGVYQQLGDSKKSLEVFRDSESRLQELQEQSGQQDAAATALADCRIRIAGLLSDSDQVDEAREVLEAVLESFDGDSDGGELAARASYTLADILADQGKLDQAAQQLEIAVNGYRKLADAPDASVNLVFGLATSLGQQGKLLADLEKLDEAVGRLKEAELLLRDRIVVSDDVDPRHAKQLAVTRSQLAAVLQELDRESESITALEATIISLEALVQLVPDVTEFREDHARALINMGQLQHLLEDSATAALYVEKGREILVGLHESADSDRYIQDIAAAQLMLALIKMDLQPDELSLVADLLDGAVNLFEQLGPDAPPNDKRILATYLAEAHLAQSVLQERIGQADGAMSPAKRAQALLETLVESGRDGTQLDALARCHQRVAHLQQLKKDTAGTTASTAAALELREELAKRGRYRRPLAVLLAESEKTRSRAIKLAQDLTQSQPYSFRTWLTLARVQMKAELWPEAHATLLEAKKRATGIPSARLHLMTAICLARLEKPAMAKISFGTGRELLQKHAPTKTDLLELAARAENLLSDPR
ncbi:protein kinase [Planctomycetaceae bacterium]|nr:protein kinase [Planctomycetaceae bacterium]